MDNANIHQHYIPDYHNHEQTEHHTPVHAAQNPGCDPTRMPESIKGPFLMPGPHGYSPVGMKCPAETPAPAHHGVYQEPHNQFNHSDDMFANPARIDTDVFWGGHTGFVPVAGWNRAIDF